MKTKNNVQKVVFKSLVIGICLVLLSFSLNAQDFRRSIINKEIINEIALAMVENEDDPQPSSTKISELNDLSSFAAYLEIEPEKTMELEDWMTNETLFNVHKKTIRTNIISTNSFIFQEIKDSKLQVEKWMTSSKYWRN